ncbi:hypothetical protein MKW92_035712 [Papaver armeniacum]|nr:hypothetical protein MKW92_035712 [Papaver armeniacum]
MSKLTLEFPQMDLDKSDLKMFEQMLRVRLGLAENEIVNLVWMVKPSLPQSLMTDDDFYKFWELAFSNVEPPPVTIIDETPKKIYKTNKKPVSKEKPKPPRRSPRFQDTSEVQSSHQQGGPSRKLLFVDLLNEVESQGGGNGTVTSQGSSQPRKETFNHDYWFNRIQGSIAHNATQGSTVDNDGNESEDEDIVHLDNESEDECNPVEDPDAPAIFDSDSENEIGYDEYVETYKVPVHNEESSSSEDEDGSGAEVEDKNDGGPKVVIDKAVGKPVWHKRYLPDMNNIGEEVDPNLFPEEDEIPVVDPDFSSTSRGRAKKQWKASYVGESSAHGKPPPVPNTQSNASAGPSNTQNFSQAISGIGYMSQNIATVSNAKGKKGKGKKK